MTTLVVREATASSSAFAALFPGGPVEGATLLVLPETAPVVASVARIDNASNDPAGLAPLPVRAP